MNIGTLINKIGNICPMCSNPSLMRYPNMSYYMCTFDKPKDNDYFFWRTHFYLSIHANELTCVFYKLPNGGYIELYNEKFITYKASELSEEIKIEKIHKILNIEDWIFQPQQCKDLLEKLMLLI